MTQNKPWIVINSGKTPIVKGEIGKFGGEKPHISFWIDENKDIRVAIWDNGDGTAHFQVTSKNDLLSTPNVIDKREDQIDVIPMPDPKPNKVDFDDDLPF
jgi:hypothetical protein